MTSKTISSVMKTKQFATLIDLGLKLISTDRQLNNGTLKFSGKAKVGRKTIKPVYAVTANGAVLSNEFVACRVEADLAGSTTGYRQGLAAVAEIFQKRISA